MKLYHIDWGFILEQNLPFPTEFALTLAIQTALGSSPRSPKSFPSCSPTPPFLQAPGRLREPSRPFISLTAVLCGWHKSWGTLSGGLALEGWGDWKYSPHLNLPLARSPAEVSLATNEPSNVCLWSTRSPGCDLLTDKSYLSVERHLGMTSRKRLQGRTMWIYLQKNLQEGWQKAQRYREPCISAKLSGNMAEFRRCEEMDRPTSSMRNRVPTIFFCQGWRLSFTISRSEICDGMHFKTMLCTDRVSGYTM